MVSNTSTVLLQTNELLAGLVTLGLRFTGSSLSGQYTVPVLLADTIPIKDKNIVNKNNTLFLYSTSYTLYHLFLLFSTYIVSFFITLHFSRKTLKEITYVISIIF